MKGVELFTELFEVVVEGDAGTTVKDIVPVALGIEVIEEETTEKAVFGIFDERTDLLGRACEQGGKAGRLDADIFLVFSADVGDSLVMEGFAEAVRVVAVVGVKGVGEGVALGLEHKTDAIVLVQSLIHGCGGGVCRDEQEAERAVREPSRRMSASLSLSATATIFLRYSGRWSRILSENVGRSSSFSGIITLSVLSTLSGDDVDNYDNLIISGRVETCIPASLASWKNVFMVMPEPWARTQRSYCESVFSCV